MKAFMVLAAFVALASAEPPSSYGAPSYSAPASQSYGAPAQQISSGYGAPSYQPTVYRHVYVHAAPDEPVYAENKVIRVPGGGDKHVNIIFVKAPSSSSQQNTEVLLPEQPQQKTVVYVLVKKPESSSDVHIRRPAAPAPSKPEVFFIRYKGADGGYGAPAAPAYGPPAPAPASPSYGAPAQPAYAPPPQVSSGYGAPAPGGY